MLGVPALARRRHAGRIRRSSTSSTAGRSTTANGGSNGANGRSAACAGPHRRPARPDVAVDAPPRPAAVRRRGDRCRCSSSTRVWRLSGSAPAIVASSVVSLALAAVADPARPGRGARRGRRDLRRRAGARRARVAQRDRLPRATGRAERALGRRLLRVGRDRPTADRRLRERVVPVPGLVPREPTVPARVRDAVDRLGRRTASRAPASASGRCSTSGVGGFVVVSLLTGAPLLAALVLWGIWHARRTFSRLDS